MKGNLMEFSLDDIPSYYYMYPGTELDDIVRNILSGRKTVECSLYLPGDDLAKPGDYRKIMGSSMRWACVVKTLRVDMVPLAEITAEIVEADLGHPKDVKLWRNHFSCSNEESEAFDFCEDPDFFPLKDDVIVAVEHFEVVCVNPQSHPYPLGHQSGSSVKQLRERTDICVDYYARNLDSEIQFNDMYSAERWTECLAGTLRNLRPETKYELDEIFGTHYAPYNYLSGLGVSEISYIYEAVQPVMCDNPSGLCYPDVARLEFMAKQTQDFPDGTWFDPACGVGLSAWYVAAAQPDPITFVREKLYLMDSDPFALDTAICFLAFSFGYDMTGTIEALKSHSKVGDYLHDDGFETDYILMNVPDYGDSVKGVNSSAQRAFNCYMEKALRNSRGAVMLSPSRFVTDEKYTDLRSQLLDQESARIFYFDKAPDIPCDRYDFLEYGGQRRPDSLCTLTVVKPGESGHTVVPAHVEKGDFGTQNVICDHDKTWDVSQTENTSWAPPQHSS